MDIFITRLRNRLLNPRVEKLVYCHQNLRVRDQITAASPLYFNEYEVEDNIDDSDDDAEQQNNKSNGGDSPIERTVQS